MMIRVIELQSGNAPQFGLLHDILVYGQGPNLLFVFDIMETLGYDRNLGAYVISPLAEFQCIYRSSMLCHYLFNAVHLDNHSYIKSKYDLSVFCNYS